MKPKDECGVIGAVSKTGYAVDISQQLYIGLCALQHRGHESAGISVSDDANIKTHKDKGTVDKVFQDDEFISPLSYLNGFAGVGHVRYSTRGESGKKNAQPIQFYFYGSDASIAHNGNLTNMEELQEIIKGRGGCKIIENTSSDTGLIAALLATSSEKSFVKAFEETLNLLKGAFSLVVLYDDKVYAAKDKNGLRPLCVGSNDKFMFVASETCALDTLECEFLCEVKPGQMVVIPKHANSLHFVVWCKEIENRSCVFEGIYLSRPDSLYRGVARVQVLREEMGRQLAIEHSLAEERVDIVSCVPDSGRAAALGYAEKIVETHPEARFGEALIRPHSTGRTFIEPVKEKRERFQRLKHNVIPDFVRGKNILVVDDSIVRGTTIRYLANELRRFGAEKVFFLSASPEIKHPCHLGVDLPNRDHFIANKKTVEEIRVELGVDYLGYLSLKGMRRAYEVNGIEPDSLCDGCMTNSYPV